MRRHDSFTWEAPADEKPCDLGAAQSDGPSKIRPAAHVLELLARPNLNSNSEFEVLLEKWQLVGSCTAGGHVKASAPATWKIPASMLARRIALADSILFGSCRRLQLVRIWFGFQEVAGSVRNGAWGKNCWQLGCPSLRVLLRGGGELNGKEHNAFSKKKVKQRLGHAVEYVPA